MSCISRVPGALCLSVNVMRGRKLLLMCSALLLVGAGTILWMCSRPSFPVVVRLFGTSETSDSTAKSVTLEFTRRGSHTLRLDTPPAIQSRVAGRWEPAHELPELSDTVLLWRTNRQDFQFLVPRQAEACRLFLHCWIGSEQYCKTYSFLQRRGFMLRFPKLSYCVLSVLPHGRKDITVEFALPGSVGRLHNETRQPTPGVRLAACWASLARRGCAVRYACTA